MVDDSQKERNPWKGLKLTVAVSTPTTFAAGQKERNPWKGLKPVRAVKAALPLAQGQKERNPWKGLKPFNGATPTGGAAGFVRRKEIPGRD